MGEIDCGIHKRRAGRYEVHIRTLHNPDGSYNYLRN